MGYSVRKKFRKFGLEYCDLPTMMWNVSFLFRTLTLNIDSRYRKRIPPIFYVLVTLNLLIYFYTYQFSLVWFLFVRCGQTKDLVAAMVALSLGISSEITIIKLCILYGYVSKIRKMVDDYLECDALVVPGSRFHNNLMRKLRSIKLRAIVYWSVIMVNSAAYIVTPLFRSGRHLLEDMYVIYGLEPKFETPNYEISNFMMGVSIFFICFVTATIAAFFIIVAGYTEAQLLSLSIEVLNVWEDAMKLHYNTVEIKFEVFFPLYKNSVPLNAEAKQFINQEVNRRLIEIIKIHAKNVNLLRQVELIFRESIAVGFIFLIISLIAELLGGLENTYLQIPFAFSQVVMDCFIGQRVMDANHILEKAIYHCKWENFDVTNRKIVLVMLQNAQKTLTLSAGSMTVLSLSTLGSVFRSIYSSYTTLRSMMNKAS